jgi:hypothetical protein
MILTGARTYVPIGRKGRTIKVVKVIVMTGRTFHTALIPPDCAKVQVLRVIDDQYLNSN